MARVGRSALNLLVILVLVGFLQLGWAQAANLPEPPFAGVPAPDAIGRYASSQSPNRSDIERITSAVDIYFTLKYESLVGGQSFDLGVVVSMLGYTVGDIISPAA